MEYRVLRLLKPEEAGVALSKLEAEGVLHIVQPDELPKDPVAALLVLRGMWADYDITAEQIRRQTWKRQA